MSADTTRDGPVTHTGRGSPYAELSRRVRQAGLLDRRPVYYAVTMTVTLALVVAGWTVFWQLGRSWLQILVAAFLAIMFTQVAFIGHDAGHRQIFSRRRANAVVGLVLGNLLVGLSYGWWVSKHNRHHAHPNEEDRDPDIGSGAIAFLEKQALARRGLGRVLTRYQAYLFFPMMLLEALHLHYSSVRAVLRGRSRSQRAEAVLLTVHLVCYFSALLLVLSPLQASVFFAVHQGLFGLYLGCSFAPNHKGMPIVTEQDGLDYLRRQVLTSRNVRGGRLVDFVLGGLNYQIEHHLFPSMPRPNLRRAKGMVRAFCAHQGVPYLESGLFASYAQAVRHLHAVGAAARRVPALSPPADDRTLA